MEADTALHRVGIADPSHKLILLGKERPLAFGHQLLPFQRLVLVLVGTGKLLGGTGSGVGRRDQGPAHFTCAGPNPMAAFPPWHLGGSCNATQSVQEF
jgi:hypothetical protein